VFVDLGIKEAKTPKVRRSDTKTRLGCVSSIGTSTFSSYTLSAASASPLIHIRHLAEYLAVGPPKPASPVLFSLRSTPLPAADVLKPLSMEPEADIDLSQIVPNELIPAISGYLAQGFYPRYIQDIKRCMLVSRSFAEIFRPHLMGHLYIHEDSPTAYDGVALARRMALRLEMVGQSIRGQLYQSSLVKRVTILSSAVFLDSKIYASTKTLLYELTRVECLTIGDSVSKDLGSISDRLTPILCIMSLPSFRTLIFGSQERDAARMKWRGVDELDPSSVHMIGSQRRIEEPYPEPTRRAIWLSGQR
jgi:hypothetical protein